MGSVGTPDYDVSGIDTRELANFREEIHHHADLYPSMRQVLVIGAGLSGIFAVYRIREIGLTVKCFESGSGEGGTWYWVSNSSHRVVSILF